MEEGPRGLAFRPQISQHFGPGWNVASVQSVHLYDHDGGVYLNITNRCPTACEFCIKKDWDWRYRGNDLLLAEGEPPAAEILKSLDERFARKDPVREVVFCGFGESTYRLDVMAEVARRVRATRPGVPLRLNTVGLGSLINGRDIAPELKGIVDEVSVSLNTNDPAQWRALHRPAREFAEPGFEAVKDFVRRCVAAGLKTKVTAVERPDVDLKAVQAWARSAGAGWRVRPAL